MEYSVTVRSPATVSNVVCGFDCLGFALREPFDEVRVTLSSQPGIRISHTDGLGLPSDPLKNVAGAAIAALQSRLTDVVGFDIQIHKGIRPGSGIGSSAASSCGAVVAADRLLGGRFEPAELVEFALAGEELASGSRHADNAAPCVFGGFVLVRSTRPLDIVELAHPPLYATVLHPQIEVKTSDARAVLPREVPLASAVRNWSNLGAFVAALGSGDLELMSRAMQDDIVEPARMALIPGFQNARQAGLEAGAIGGGISGSGPSIFMLSADERTASSVADAMSVSYAATGLDFRVYISEVGGSAATE